MNIRETLNAAEARLEKAKVPDARLDAEYLLAEALHAPRLSLLIDKLREVPENARAEFEKSICRREKREPLQYILGTQPFMGLELKTDARALIPRNDTEALCLAALEVIPVGGRVLDLCTGTGAIALAIKTLRRDADVFASDLSEQALALARENAEKLKSGVSFFLGDLFKPLENMQFDVIVSNPPYIPDSLRGKLQEEVLKEPEMALFAGTDGLDFYRRIAKEAPKYLNQAGYLLLEIGDDQFEAVSGLLQANFEDIQLIRDMNGKPRGIKAKKF